MQLSERGEQINDLLQQKNECLQREMAAKATVRDLEKKLINSTKEASQAMLTSMDLIKKNELLKNEVDLLRKEVSVYAAMHPHVKASCSAGVDDAASTKKRRVDSYDPRNYSEIIEVNHKTPLHLACTRFV